MQHVCIARYVLYTVSVCLSVCLCHTPLLYRTGETDQAGFRRILHLVVWEFWCLQKQG